MRAEGLRRLRRRRRAWMDDLKRKPCADCGEEYPPFVMDFDHRPDEEKLFAVSAAIPMGLGERAILEEAAKCDVVCANCHRFRTFRRRDLLPAPPPAIPPPSERTHCPQGHPYDAENTRTRVRKGHLSRECIKCVRTQDRHRSKIV